MKYCLGTFSLAGTLKRGIWTYFFLASKPRILIEPTFSIFIWPYLWGFFWIRLLARLQSPMPKKLTHPLYTHSVFIPFFWLGLNFPNLTDFALLNSFNTVLNTFLGSHLALKFLNFNEVACSKLTQRLDFIKKSSFFTFKFSKHFILIAFLLPPGLKNSLALIPLPGISSSK